MRKVMLLVMLCCLAAGVAWPAWARKSVADKLGEQFAKELAEQTKAVSDMHPELKGSVKLGLTVDKGGFVSLVETKENRLDDTAPLAGILETVYAWKFSELAIEEKTVTFDHVIGFNEGYDSTRMFFVAMGVVMVTIAALIILIRVV